MSRNLLQILLSFAIVRGGTAIGLSAVRYRGVGPILTGTALYPPGYLDPNMPQEGRDKCKGAEDLWLWASLKARGIKAVGLAPHLSIKLAQSWRDGADTFAPDSAWGVCFEHLWPKLGMRLNGEQPRVSLFVRPPDTKFLRRLAPTSWQSLVKHWAEMDYRYLLDQARRPGTVYILDDGSLHGHVDRWVGGLDGFQVRVLPCAECNERDQFMAAMGVEWNPDALLLFVTAERLISDQVVLENLRCAMRKLAGMTDSTKYCGYYMHMRSDRFVEMAMLRKQLNVGG